MQAVGRETCLGQISPDAGPGAMGALVLEHIGRLEGPEFLRAWLRYFLSATLDAGKPGTLLSLGEVSGLASLWREHGAQCMGALGLEWRQLHSCPNAVCVLFYRSEVLSGWLAEEDNAALLSEAGYDASSLENALDTLAGHFTHGCPHEIGIFLGIPAEEVRAFTAVPRPRLKAVGYWQVFGDIKTALSRFADYDMAFRRAGLELLKAVS